MHTMPAWSCGTQYIHASEPGSCSASPGAGAAPTGSHSGRQLMTQTTEPNIFNCVISVIYEAGFLDFSCTHSVLVFVVVCTMFNLRTDLGFSVLYSLRTDFAFLVLDFAFSVALCNSAPKYPRHRNDRGMRMDRHPQWEYHRTCL